MSTTTAGLEYDSGLTNRNKKWGETTRQRGLTAFESPEREGEFTTRQFEFFELRYYAGFTLVECAKRMDIKLSTAKRYEKLVKRKLHI